MEKEQKTQVMQVFQMSMEDLKDIIREAVISGLPPVNNSNETLCADSDDENSDLLTREEVKNILKVSYPTLWKYNRDGILKAKKIGSRVYYSKADLYNLLNSAA